MCTSAVIIFIIITQAPALLNPRDVISLEEATVHEVIRSAVPQSDHDPIHPSILGLLTHLVVIINGREEDSSPTA